jgi:phage-related minor tail protein
MTDQGGSGSNPKAQLQVEANTDPAISSLDKLEKKAISSANTIGKAGDTAAEGVGKIGGGAEKSADTTDRATNRILSAIQRITRETASGGRNTPEYFEALARDANVNSPAVTAGIENYRRALIAREQADKQAAQALLANQQAMRTARGEANNLTQAYRQLPAQITDITTSLISGQPAFIVAIQQGGQLKDSFGGIVPAAKALSIGLLQAINPVTVLAGTIGALAFGFAAGARENDAYTRAIVLTGQAAGVTASELQKMAAAAAANTGATAGRAGEVARELASTGLIGAQNLQRFTEAALELERVGGTAAEETAKAFADLAKSPLQGALRLNESTNFLSASLLDQVKALEDVGRTTEAAALVQEAYYNTVRDRAGEVDGSLGLIESGWRGIKDAIAGAVDALKDIGRPDTLREQVQAIEAAISAAQRAQGNDGGGLIGRLFAGREAALREELALLQEQARLQARGAESDAERLKQTRARAEAQKVLDSLLTREERQRRELETTERKLLAAGVERGKIETALAAVREKYKDTGTNRSEQERLRELEAQVRLVNQLSGLTSTYADDIGRLNALLASRSITEERYGELVRELVERQPFRREAAKQTADALKEEDRALKAATAEWERYYKSLQRDLEREQNTNQGLEDELLMLQGGKQLLEDRVQLRLGEAAAALETAASAALLERADMASYAVLRDRAAEIRRQIELRKQLAAAGTAKAARDATDKAAKDAQREWQRANDQIGQGLADALIQGGKSAAEYIEGTFRAMVLRPVIQAIVSPVAGLFTSALGIGGQGGVAGGLSSAGGALNLFNAGRNLQAGFGAFQLGVSNTAGTLYANATGTGLDGLLASNGGFGTAGTGTGWATSVGTAAGYAAGIAGGIFGGRTISNGYSTGGSGNANVNVGTAIGTAIAGPIGALVGGLLGGATNALFGRRAPQVTDQGITGSIGGGNFTGTTFADIFEKGGFFRSDRRRTDTAALPQDVERFFDDAAAAVLEKTAEFGAALGLPAEQLSSITSQIRLTLGNDAKENQTAITSALSGYAAALVQAFTDDVAPLRAYGETTAQTIERVGGSLLRVNDILGLLGQTALATSVQGGQAAVQIEALLGADNFRQLAGTFFENFYTAAEKEALKTELLTAELAKAGVNTLPATRDAYRELVEAQDMTTESGRETYAALLALSPAFAELVAATEELGDTSAQVAAKMAEAGRRALASLQEQRSQLEEDLLRAQGNNSAADQAERARLLGGITSGLNTADAAAATAAFNYNIALQEQIAALRAATAAEEEAAARRQAIAEEGADLERRILEATGDTAALRQLELDALDESNRPLLQRYFALVDEAEAAQAAAAASQALAGEREGLERRLLQQSGDTAALRQLELDAVDASNRALLELIFQREDDAAAAQEAARLTEEAARAEERAAEERLRVQQAIEQEGFGLEGRLLQLQGDTAALRQRELEAVDAANRSILLRIFALEDEQAAAQAAAALAQDRRGLEREILELEGDTAALRALELASLDASLRPLQERIFAMRDEQAAAEAAGRALAALNNTIDGLSRQRVSLQADLLDAQGNPAAASALRSQAELEQLTAGLSGEDAERVRVAYELNQALREQIAEAQAAQRAAAEAARAAEQLRNAWQSVTDSILDQVAAIRRQVAGGGAESLAEAQARFSIVSAQARAGDQDAARQLPQLAQALLAIGEAQADSALELARLRALTAASLEATAGQIGRRFGLTIPALDRGTNMVERGGLALLHEGEAVVPRQYNPAIGGGNQTGDMAAELRKQREEARAQSARTRELQTRMTKLLERWEANGLPETRVVS